MSHALFNIIALVAVIGAGFGYSNGALAPENAFFVVYATLVLLIGRLFLTRAHMSFSEAVRSMVNLPRTRVQGLAAASYMLAVSGSVLVAGTIATV